MYCFDTQIIPLIKLLYRNCYGSIKSLCTGTPDGKFLNTDYSAVSSITSTAAVKTVGTP